MFFRWYFKLFLIFIFFTFCNENKQNNVRVSDTVQNSTLKIKHAKHFSIKKRGNKTIIFITKNYQDTIYFEINKAYSRLAVLGTIPTFQLTLLNASENIVAIDDIKYYNNKTIQSLYYTQKITEVLPNLQWNYEKLLLSKPEIVITYSELNDNIKLQNLLQENNIQQLLYLDYLEQHPLGRAEWIKVLGCLINKEKKADSIFNVIEEKYNYLKKIKDKFQDYPKVLTELMIGDVWYIAGNQSYIGQLIKDAGGKYVFDFHNYENSRPYSFEYVLKYAQNADVWLNLHQFKSLQEIKNANEKYSLFQAFQNKRCFSNNKIVNKHGYSDYYESGICLPHLLLEDMIRILHGNYSDIKDSLHYYYRLPEK